MDKRFHNKIMEIKDLKDTWIEMAQKCNIDIKKFQNAVLDSSKNRLTQQELYNVFKYSKFNISYNELLQIFGYNTDNNIIIRGDIYWVDFGDSKGSLQGGLRPAVIVSNNLNNKFSPTVQVAPITSSVSKKDIPAHVIINGCGLQKISTILTEQIKVINKYELGEFIGACDKEIINKINIAMGVQFDIETNVEDTSIILSYINHLVENVKMKDTEKFKKVLLNQLNNFQCQVSA